MRRLVIEDLPADADRAPELHEIACAFPENVGVKRYALEYVPDRSLVGAVAAKNVPRRGGVRWYMCGVLCGGMTFEAARYEQDPGRVELYARGERAGAIVETSVRGGTPVRWDVKIGADRFGSIVRPWPVVSGSIDLEAADGERIPLRLARRDTITDFLRAIRNVVLVLTLHRIDPAPNLNVVIPWEAAERLNSAERDLVFLVGLVFRMLYFDHDFSSAG